MSDVATDVFRFHGAISIPAAAGAYEFIQATTGTPGDIVAADKGVLSLPLAATEEAECNRLLQSIAPYRLADLKRVKFVVACSANLGDDSEIAFGICDTPNDDPDSIDDGAWFKVLADNTVVCESDDGTNDNDDVATGQSLGTTLREFVIDFTTGVWRKDPRDGGAVGGSAAVQFKMTDSNGLLRQVAKSTQFDISNCTDELQLFAQIYKSSSTDTGNLYIKEIQVDYKQQLFAVA